MPTRTGVLFLMLFSRCARPALALALLASAPALAESPPAAAKRPPAGMLLAQGGPAAARAPAASPLTEQAVVARANAYLNGFNTLIGDFVQQGGDGRRLKGKLYLQRPGKLRFDYEAPATLEVVADGSSVVVRDRKLATYDLYPIGQTPLKFLTRERIDLGRDVRITGASSGADGAQVQLEDATTFGGTSKITLYFDPTVTTLTRWRIVDPQGFQTTVQLANLDTARRVDPRVFAIDYSRDIVGEGMNR